MYTGVLHRWNQNFAGGLHRRRYVADTIVAEQELVDCQPGGLNLGVYYPGPLSPGGSVQPGTNFTTLLSLWERIRPEFTENERKLCIHSNLKLLATSQL